MIADPNGIDFGTKTYRFGHFSGPSYRGAHAGWPAALLGGQLGFFETYVNQGARAFCLHVNRRPHSQPANKPSARLGTFETRVNKAHGHADLHVKGEFRPPQRGPPQGPHGGWPAGWLVGWLAGWLGHQKSVKNAYPQGKSASKTCTLRQKVVSEAWLLGWVHAKSQNNLQPEL